MKTQATEVNSLKIEQALRAARETRALEIGAGIRRAAPRVFRAQFGNRPAVLVADENTLAAAGTSVLESFRAARHPVLEPFVFRADGLFAEDQFVSALQSALATHAAIPVAVGSGTVNDLTKLASHRTDRPYMCVATAASMDGYTAFGASITHHGAKQTFLCPAPAAVVADLEVIGAAPAPMNSWGYADLVAKVTAGADWILADALGIEPIEAEPWAIVQSRLRELIADGAGVPAREPHAIHRLVEGLMLGGFAMQSAKSSRPASGAEHQFSHLWDMQHHTHQGRTPSHGFKVGIGTLAMTALYEELLQMPLDQLGVESCCTAWPSPAAWEQRIRQGFGEGELAKVALAEALAKQPEAQDLRGELEQLRRGWPQLRKRLTEQLVPLGTLRKMLEDAGAPTEPEQIGVSRPRLRDSYWRAYCIRRRFTALDLALRAGVLEQCLERIFGRHGIWPIEPQNQTLVSR